MRKQLDVDAIIRDMRGKWEAYLTEVCGWPSTVFNGRHQACPVCGGKDRFRWGHNNSALRGDGFGFCSGEHGSLSGVNWVRASRRVEFIEAIREIDDWLGGVTPEKTVLIERHRRSVVRSGGNATKMGGQNRRPDVFNRKDDGSVVLCVADAETAREVAEYTDCEVWNCHNRVNLVDVVNVYAGNREVVCVSMGADDTDFYQKKTSRSVWGGAICGAYYTPECKFEPETEE